MHVIGGGLYRFPSRRRLGWAALLARVFAVDVMLCTTCGGRLRLVAVLSDQSTKPQCPPARALWPMTGCRNNLEEGFEFPILL